MIALLLALACGRQGSPPAGSAPANSVAPAPRPDQATDRYGWLSEVTLQPEQFAEVMATGREGWIAYHANDFVRALDAFPPADLGQARVMWSLYLLNADLARLSGFANDQFFSEWEARTGLPPDSAAPVVATLASYCSESGTLAGWASRAKEGQAGFDMAQEIARGRSPWDVEGSDAFARRMALHRLVRTEGEVEPLMRAAMRPVIVEQAGEFERVFYDPCLHRTTADYWLKRTADTLDGTDWQAIAAFADRGLAGRIFSPWLRADDLRSELRANPEPGAVGARSPSLRAFGVGTNPHAGDDLNSALTEIASLDHGLARWRAELESSAGDDGRALIADLDLFERFRQEWLTTRARYALVEDRPRQGLAYAEAARNVTDRFVGAANGPVVWALLAEANLRLGHTREALDALHILSGTHPEIVGLKELTGNLAVLRGIGEAGDSKEE